MKEKLNIAIDGPAGAGKSTVAKLVAKDLGYIYIDTGAMYRALTYKAILKRIDLQSNKSLGNLLKNTKIELNPTGQVYLDGKEVSYEIRSEEVTNSVSFVASHKDVRTLMLERQRNMAIKGGTVMDGRDIGTAVLPNAKLKIYLSATVEERARRRHEENLEKGFPSNYNQLIEEIALRDKRDTEREQAPLKKAPDAIEIDSTKMSIQDVVTKILELAKERI